MVGSRNGEVGRFGVITGGFHPEERRKLMGDFRHTDFGRIILPFTLLRRLECVLEPTRQDVRDAHQAHKEAGIDPDLILRQTTRHPFYHTSGDTLITLGSTRKGQKNTDSKLGMQIAKKNNTCPELK